MVAVNKMTKRYQIRPTTTDPGAMMRDGYHEPARVFPPPPFPILEGPLEDRALDILEFAVGVYRVSTHERVMRDGVCWSDVQQWYDVGGNDDMKRRIYAGLAFLVEAGYLREGRKDVMPPHPKLTSDYFMPTEKGYAKVNVRQASLFAQSWHWIERHDPVARLIGAATLVTLVAAAVAFIVRSL